MRGGAYVPPAPPIECRLSIELSLVLNLRGTGSTVPSVTKLPIKSLMSPHLAAQWYVRGSAALASLSGHSFQWRVALSKAGIHWHNAVNG